VSNQLRYVAYIILDFIPGGDLGSMRPMPEPLCHFFFY
jgi:serine/threonine protein kinase